MHQEHDGQWHSKDKILVFQQKMLRNWNVTLSGSTISILMIYANLLEQPISRGHSGGQLYCILAIIRQRNHMQKKWRILFFYESSTSISYLHQKKRICRSQKIPYPLHLINEALFHIQQIVLNWQLLYLRHKRQTRLPIP